MYKRFLILGSIITGSIAIAQVRTTGNVNTIGAGSSSFIDASSNAAWNTDTGNVGKGLVFPRTDLVKLTQLVSATPANTSNFPTRMDGMIVYNTATGNSAIGNVAVKPGFYYYENKTTNLNGGTWKPIGGDASSTLPTTATNGQVLKWNGSAWTAQADNNTTYTGSTSVVLSGNSFQRAALTGDVTSAQNNNTVTINNGAVTGAKIANGTITADKLAPGVIPAATVEVDGIIGNEVTNATANRGLVRAGSGTATAPYTLGIADNGVTTAMIANNAITTDKIGNGAITANKLGAMGATTAGQVLKWNGSAWAPATDTDANTTYTAGTGIEITGSNNVIAIKTPVKDVSADYTLTDADNNGYVYVNAAGGTTITVPSTLPVGFSCIIVQQGAGQVTIAGTGVTLQSARGTKTRKQYSAVGIIKRATGEATITGDAVE